MNLYILRHGIAVEPGSPGYAKDADRPLTPEGERKLGQIAEAMEALDLTFDLILSSPCLRARQTAEIMAEVFHARKKLEFTDNLTPGASPKKLVELLNGLTPQPEDVLLSGHEPFLSGLISLLVSGEPGLSAELGDRSARLGHASGRSCLAWHCEQGGSFRKPRLH